MKKFLAALVLALAISSSCFAAGAVKNFTAEEKAADALIGALTGNSVTYEVVSKNFSEGLKKNLTAEKFAELKKQIKDQVGTVKEANFITYAKQYNPQTGYNNVEEMLYLGTVNKEKLARFVVLFAVENNVPKIVSFQVAPMEVNGQQPAEKK